jgi:hypothetical protein
MPIELISNLIPAGSNTFFLLEDIFLKGGYQVRQDITDRDSIEADNRKAGMAVWTISENALWILNVDLITWVEFSSHLVFMGTYNVLYNTPILPNPALSAGYVYRVLGKGTFTYNPLNSVISRTSHANGNALNPQNVWDNDPSTYATLNSPGVATWYGFKTRLDNTLPTTLTVLMNPPPSTTPNVNLDYSLDGNIWVPLVLSGYNYIALILDLNPELLQIRVMCSSGTIHIQDIRLEYSLTLPLLEGDYLFSNGLFWDSFSNTENIAINLNLGLATKVNLTSVGATGGVASLDSNRLVPRNQIPSAQVLLDNVIISNGIF